MNLAQVKTLLSAFVLFFSVAAIVPLLTAWSSSDPAESTTPFVVTLAVGLGLGGVLRIGKRPPGKDLYRREGIAVVGVAWFIAGLLGAIPFLVSGSITTVVDAYFESISGLTTTGATVLGTTQPSIESLAPSLLLWRALLQWVGGIGIVLVFIVLLPSMGMKGSRLLSSEQIGVNDPAVRPRMADQARKLFGLYVGLTVLAASCYWVAGLSAFDAVCHSLTTLATGGFSNHAQSVGGYASGWIELVSIVFMFLAGCNFLFLLSTVVRRQGTGAHRREFLVYLVLTIVLGLAVAGCLRVWGGVIEHTPAGSPVDYSSMSRCIRDGFFQVVSILTSTGFATADFEQWPKTAQLLIFLCMFVGGCTGSTAGGFKVLRVAVLAKVGLYVFRRFLRPRRVQKLRIGHDLVSEETVTTIVGLLVLWLLWIVAGTFILSLDPRLDLVTSATASTSMMGCVGPAFGETTAGSNGAIETVGALSLGPMAGYGDLHPATKAFMCFQMVLGRLEILAPFALLSSGLWRK